MVLMFTSPRGWREGQTHGQIPLMSPGKGRRMGGTMGKGGPEGGLFCERKEGGGGS